MALGDSIDVPPEQNVSLRLLHHFASAIRHQQYHDVDIVTVRVKRAPGLQGNATFRKAKGPRLRNGATERAGCGCVQLPRDRQTIVSP